MNGVVCSGIPLDDLTPLTKLKLRWLSLTRLPVSDLSPLANQSLKRLDFYQMPVSDLAPFAKMQLESFFCFECPVTDLSLLKNMPLTSFDITNIPVTDLSPIIGKKLTTLHIHGFQLPDISFIKSMPLIDVSLDFRPYFEPDEQLLRSLPLTTINGLPAAKYWENLARQKQSDAEFAEATSKLAPAKVVEAVIARVSKPLAGIIV